MPGRSSSPPPPARPLLTARLQILVSEELAADLHRIAYRAGVSFSRFAREELAAAAERAKRSVAA